MNINTLFEALRAYSKTKEVRNDADKQEEVLRAIVSLSAVKERIEDVEYHTEVVVVSKNTWENAMSMLTNELYSRGGCATTLGGYMVRCRRMYPELTYEQCKIGYEQYHGDVDAIDEPCTSEYNELTCDLYGFCSGADCKQYFQCMQGMK